MAKISARVFDRSNRYVPSASQRADHFSSSPSRTGFSGKPIAGQSTKRPARSAASNSAASARLARSRSALIAERTSSHTTIAPDETDQALELPLLEDEHLRHEDLHEQPPFEPPQRVDAGTWEPDRPDHDQRPGDQRRDHRAPLGEPVDAGAVERERHRDQHLGTARNRSSPSTTATNERRARSTRGTGCASDRHRRAHQPGSCGGSVGTSTQQRAHLRRELVVRAGRVEEADGFAPVMVVEPTE